MKRYRLKRRFVIDAGTEFTLQPRTSTRYGKSIEAPVALSKDNTGYLSMSIEDALESGLLEELDG